MGIFSKWFGGGKKDITAVLEFIDNAYADGKSVYYLGGPEQLIGIHAIMYKSDWEKAKPQLFHHIAQVDIDEAVSGTSRKVSIRIKGIDYSNDELLRLYSYIGYHSHKGRGYIDTNLDLNPLHVARPEWKGRFIRSSLVFGDYVLKR